LQCVAVYCSALLCVAGCCKALRHPMGLRHPVLSNILPVYTHLQGDTYIRANVCIYTHAYFAKSLFLPINALTHPSGCEYRISLSHTRMYPYIYTYVYLHIYACTYGCAYRVATMSSLLQIIGLFCKRALQKRLYSAKETYHSKEPTSLSNPISCFSLIYTCVHLHVHACILTYIRMYIFHHLYIV